jgi:hypothetical protein
MVFGERRFPMDEFDDLETYLRRIPAIEASMRGCKMGKGRFNDGD